MVDGDGSISGDDWQQYVDELLQCHHKGEYQRVPATKGDCGLEGYTHCGNGYQSYSDQDSKTHAERTRKQRKKINDDIKKLKKNEDFWSTIFGAKRLRRWILVVPNFDEKELLTYAAKKRDELKHLNLSFIADDFEIVIHTHRDYPTARTLLQDPLLACNTVLAAPGTPAQLLELQSTQPMFVQNIDNKLQKAMPGTPKQIREDAAKQFLNWHLKCANYLEDLRSKFPTLWEQIDELTSTMAESLQTEGYFDSTSPPERLSNVRKRLEETMEKKAMFAQGGKQMVLSWGHVARWLGECPLDFVGSQNGS